MNYNIKIRSLVLEVPIQKEKEKDIDFIKITEDNIESKVNPVVKNNLELKPQCWYDV